MRTGSIGNRDAETLIKTLVEPKKTVLTDVRKELLSLGFSEEAGYDAINIESYVAYSLEGKNRLFAKHKWELAIVISIEGEIEQKAISSKFPQLSKVEFGRNEEYGTVSIKLDPVKEKELIFEIAKYFLEYRAKS